MTPEAEAKTPEAKAEARFFGLEADAEFRGKVHEVAEVWKNKKFLMVD